MAYQGTTSTAANPPFLVSQGIGSTAGAAGQKEWRYESTHTQAAAAAAGFFTDGQKLGMAVGDRVLVVGSTTYATSFHAVNAVTSTGAGLTSGLLTSSAS